MNHATGTRIDTQTISFNSLTATLFHSCFARKCVFYSKNINYAHNFYGTNLYENVCRGVFRTQSNIYMVEILCKNYQRSLLQMFGQFLNTSLAQVSQQKSFTECQYLPVIEFLFLKLIKHIFVQLFHDGGLYHKETSPLIYSPNEQTSFYMIGNPAVNELTKKV